MRVADFSDRSRLDTSNSKCSKEASLCRCSRSDFLMNESSLQARWVGAPDLGGCMQAGVLEHHVRPDAWPRALERVAVGVVREGCAHVARYVIAYLPQCRMPWRPGKRPLQHLQRRIT